MSKEGIGFAIITPYGTVTISLNKDKLIKIRRRLNAVVDDAKTSIPQIFKDAFKEDNTNGDTD